MTEQDIERTVEKARRAAPAQTAGRSQRWRWVVLSRLDRKRSPRRLAAIVAAGGLAAVAIVGWRYLDVPSVSDRSQQPTPAAATGRPTPPPEARVQQLADGSRIFPDGPSTVVEKRLETSERVVYALEAGSARFEVAPQRSRSFHVQAGPVAVKVIGTRFRVQRRGGVSHISVTEGRVLVSWSDGALELGAGEEGTFPPDKAPPPTASIPKTQTARAPATEARPAALFARADRARKDGNPGLAAAHLRTIVERHPDDPHAGAAAFTLGRLLLDSLNRPLESAAWFERARLLAQGRPLAEDALAREVEAWKAAGNDELARRRAELYRQTYPSGSRLGAVLRLGGLQPAP